MRINLLRTPRRRWTAALAATAAAAALPLLGSPSAGAVGSVPLPPAHAGFDYQIGGPYTPPAGVSVVSRDHDAPPAAGLYNICYVNAFQTQEGAESDWDADLLLHNAKGKVVKDPDWDEAILDIRTAANRQRIAAKVDGWIDQCAAKGFQAVEPDNLDTFDRFPSYLTQGQAEAYIQLLSAHAHAKNLAIAQKNTAELSADHAVNGLDFAVAEECADYNECGDYTAAYGNEVFVIEYTAKGLTKACSGWGGTLSVVRRDVDVVPQGTSGYVRKTC
ncbi:endo alpha-1,4 polygalactosaminidase [Streptomyces sp. NBC_01190]|uniref:endo alpha-1,4 polygalactosaminidase n=1 Tax=Streptomyces sp. NBC_01190 TaxID=2903767 RepID=UPI00386549A1